MPKPSLPQDLPSVEYLRECFDYDPETGVLTWKERPREHFNSQLGHRRFNNRFIGKEVGTGNSHGYLIVIMLNRTMRVHRIIWKMHYGEEPHFLLDHINGVKDDNRIENLRDVPQTVNGLGMTKSRKNTSGHTGVFWDTSRKKWAAQVSYRGKAYYLGRYSDMGDAIAARKRANKALGFSSYHGQDAPTLRTHADMELKRKKKQNGDVGVYLVKSTSHWVARLSMGGKTITIGTFPTKEAAIAARQSAKKQSLKNHA